MTGKSDDRINRIKNPKNAKIDVETSKKIKKIKIYKMKGFRVKGKISYLVFLKKFLLYKELFQLNLYIKNVQNCLIKGKNSTKIIKISLKIVKKMTQ